MSRHSKRTKPNRRNSHQRSEARVARRRSRVAKGRTKRASTTDDRIGGVRWQAPDQNALLRAMLGLR